MSKLSKIGSVTADVIVIGAGISGVAAATVLQAQGVNTCVIDKGRSVGGRMATRRIGNGLADHGAQFFTVRSPEFQEQVDRWTEQGVVRVWANGFSDGSLLMENRHDGHPRYIAVDGMNALVKHIATDLDNVKLNLKIVTATCDDEGWILQDEDGNLYTSNALIITTPIPQALPILAEGATDLAEKDFEALSSITYAPSLTGMFVIDGPVTLPPPGAVQRRNTSIAWIGDNLQKGISPKERILTVQASERYSTQMWSAPDGRILSAMRTHLQLFLPQTSMIREAQLKRWRYATPVTTYPAPFLVAESEVPLMFAGDAFAGPTIERAFHSGLAVGEAMAQLLDHA